MGGKEDLEFEISYSIILVAYMGNASLVGFFCSHVVFFVVFILMLLITKFHLNSEKDLYDVIS